MKDYQGMRIIGIDNGYGNIKTANCCFPAGLTAHDVEPVFKDELLVYGGRYYLIGTGHKEFTADKTGDDDYYILTLAAIARELNVHGLTDATVRLAVGLPLTWVSQQREDFKAYITVTHKTANEMADAYNFTADQRAQLAELLAEENRSMWSSVLYGIGVGDGEIVVVALSQLGNVGGQPYWSWYGFNSRVEWCACFVSWCANECGYLDAGVIPKTAGCISGSNWFKDRGLWQDNSYEPRPGDIIYFDWDNKGSSGPQDGLADHVGIVEKVENGLVYTVEGNSGDSCRENRYAIGHYEIYGYGTPAY